MQTSPRAPGFLKAMDTVLDAIASLCRALTGLALVVLVAIGGWLVYGRYVLNETPTWVEQASLLLVMLIAFLGAAVGVHDHTHLSVVILRKAVPTWLRTILVVITDLLMLGFGAFMFWYGLELTLFKWGSLIPLLQVPEGLRSLPLTVGGVLISLFSFGHLIRLCLSADTRKDSIE